jgi:hypothetical protein
MTARQAGVNAALPAPITSWSDVIDSADKSPGQDDFQVDSDGDGASDALDRFAGDDYGDADGDGRANWVDLQPLSAATTVSPATTQPPTPTQAADVTREAVLNEQASKLNDENAALQGLIDQADRELRDTDGDQISNIYDTQPFNRFGDDDDGDGTSNGRDQFPLSDSAD